MPYIFYIFFGFKPIFVNGYLEVVNFIGDRLLHCNLENF